MLKMFIKAKKMKNWLEWNLNANIFFNEKFFYVCETFPRCLPYHSIMNRGKKFYSEFIISVRCYTCNISLNRNHKSFSDFFFANTSSYVIFVWLIAFRIIIDRQCQFFFSSFDKAWSYWVFSLNELSDFQL